MNVSAVVLSKTPRVMPYAIAQINHVSSFDDCAGQKKARIEAIKKVTTDWFFFLDDDDELPSDYLRVIDACVSKNAAVAYTNELITKADGSSSVRKSCVYSQDEHIANPYLLHNLVVCKTSVAKKAIKKVPEGQYHLETLLFFEIAKSGAAFVDETGYIYHKRNGTHSHPTTLLGLVQSQIWCNRNRNG